MELGIRRLQHHEQGQDEKSKVEWGPVDNSGGSGQPPGMLPFLLDAALLARPQLSCCTLNGQRSLPHVLLRVCARMTCMGHWCAQALQHGCAHAAHVCALHVHTICA